MQRIKWPIIVNIHNYFQTRELYEKLSEYKNDIDKLNNFIMWFITSQCTQIKI